MTSYPEFTKQFIELRTKLAHLSDLDICEIFQVSGPTIGRWLRGECAPHPIGQGPILVEMQRMVDNGE